MTPCFLLSNGKECLDNLPQLSYYSINKSNGGNMAYYNIVNHLDNSKNFMVATEDYDYAAHKALEELGWYVDTEPVKCQLPRH